MKKYSVTINVECIVEAHDEDEARYLAEIVGEDAYLCYGDHSHKNLRVRGFTSDRCEELEAIDKAE